MKITTYQIEKILPKNEDEYYNLCNIFDKPSLKSGYIDIISNPSKSTITKKDFNKIKKVACSYYCNLSNKFISGFLDVCNYTFICIN